MVASSVATIQVHHHPSEIQSNERVDEKQSIRDVLTNDSRWRSLYTILILGACIANAFILTSIPRQNSILFPDYWYEGIFCAVFGASFRDSCGHILDLFIFTREKGLLTWTHFMKVFFICSILFAAPYCIFYYTWTLYIGYNHPMPFNGMFLLLGEILTYMMTPLVFVSSKIEIQNRIKKTISSLFDLTVMAYPTNDTQRNLVDRSWNVLNDTVDSPVIDSFGKNFRLLGCTKNC